MTAERITYLTEHVRDMLAEDIPSSALSLVPRSDFTLYPVQPQFRYGFLPPIMTNDRPDNRIAIVPICPELLVLAAEGLSDKLFDLYVETICMVIVKHVALFDKIPDGCKRHDAVIDLLADEVPVSIQILLDCQAHLIDSEAVPVAPGAGL